MNTSRPKDDSYDVSDSTDWLNTPLSSLADVESLLRCQCPTCRSVDQEIKLKSNGVVEDLVEAFKRARPAALELARKPAIEPNVVSPKRKRGPPDSDEAEQQASKRTRASSRRATQQAQTIDHSEEIVVIEDGEDDDDFIPEDGLSECPVCQRRMTAKEVETHIGRCLVEHENSTKSTSSLSKPGLMSPKPVKRPERLPHINFNLIKEQQLKKKLSEQGLSTTGGRAMMIKRLTEYTTIWNANCDAKNPRSSAQLKKDLDAWERTLGSRAPQPSSLAAQIKDKDFDGAAWGTQHKTDFSDLIARARQNVKSKQQKTLADGGEGSNDQPSDSTPTVQDTRENVRMEGSAKERGTDVMESRKEFENTLEPPPPSSQVQIPEGSQQRSRRFFEETEISLPTSSTTGLSSQLDRTLPFVEGKTDISTIWSSQP
ncbi:E3 ubiquitin-protein ligase rad18 [Clarireedia jacksonii]